MNFDRFIDEFNDCFGPPFIEEGIVKAYADVQGDGLCIKIGNRDIQFDPNMKVIGRGTSVDKPRVLLSGISTVATECPDCSRTSKHQEFGEADE